MSAGPHSPDEPVALGGEKLRMFPGEQRRQILEIVNTRGSIRVSELATLVRVTEPTVRKDISDLDALRFLRRTHGGALAARVHRRRCQRSSGKDRYLLRVRPPR